MSTITKQQAGRFILMKQGLYGAGKFSGKEGILQYIKQAGCIQFDPIDICGKNHELVLQSRIINFKKQNLYELLYEDRVLIDWFDKNMSITSIEDWPYLDSHRKYYRNNGRGKAEIDNIVSDVINCINQNGPVCSADIKYNEKVNWSWGPTSLARAALDTLFFRGELVIHHKKNTRKYYDLASRHVPGELLKMDNPCQSEEEKLEWHVQRRIKSVGLLWKRASDAWLGVPGLKSAGREAAFNSLMQKGVIKKVGIEGIKFPVYYAAADEAMMGEAINAGKTPDRTEFIAPLDNMMWDRKLIKEIFNFDYKWEIYTPVKERKYSYYVLPLLYGDKLAGRIEIVKNKDAGKLEMQNLWLEKGIGESKKLHDSITRRLNRFNLFYKS